MKIRIFRRGSYAESDASLADIADRYGERARPHAGGDGGRPEPGRGRLARLLGAVGRRAPQPFSGPLSVSAANGDCADWAWIDLERDEQDELRDLAERLEFHALALEQALDDHARPKVRRFGTHVLLTVAASLVRDDGEVELARLSAFLTPRLVVTSRDADFPIGEVVDQLEDNEDLGSAGVSVMVWALLDTLVDDNIESLVHLDDVAEELAHDLFDKRDDATGLQRRAFDLRRAIARTRHATLPLRDAVTTLVRRDEGFVPEQLRPYFDDVYDHTMHAADWAESLRDQVESVLETNVALQGNEMNLVMKKVTSWAAIIAVPTMITGYFGQNLEFPLFQTPEGWWISNVLIALSSVGLALAFKRRDWL